MKKHLVLTILLLGLASVGASAADPKTPNSKPQTPNSPAPADDYPLKTCIVSDEPLGSMGDAVVYTHREPGKPDRVVRFCCEGCIEDFRQNPEKFLKKLDDAKAAAAKKKPDQSQKKS